MQNVGQINNCNEVGCEQLLRSDEVSITFFYNLNKSKNNDKKISKSHYECASKSGLGEAKNAES